jgi:hypothetical protein
VDVLIDSPPAAGAEGFVENIVKSRELGDRYLTKRCIQAQPLALDAERTSSGFCSRELLDGRNKAQNEAGMLVRHYS